MKKSIIFYFLALTVSIIAYINNIFTFLIINNSLNYSSNGSLQMYLHLAIIIFMLPLFILSIYKMVKSVKKDHEVSMISIVLLMVNLIVMFCLYTYAIVSNFNETYGEYTRLIYNESTTEDMIKLYKFLRTNTVYTLIIELISPVVYIVTSILALVFKSKESIKNI